jgi:hypothetical protein
MAAKAPFSLAGSKVLVSLDCMVADAVERNWSPTARTGNFLKISGQNRLVKEREPLAIRNSNVIQDSYVIIQADSCYSAKQAIEARKQAM